MVQPVFKKIEGEEYLYEATYPSGNKKYVVRANRAGVPGIKRYFPFTAKGLNDAKKRRTEWVTESNKILAEKRAAGEVADPAIKKLKNPPDPKKPWRYLRSGSQRGPKKAKRITEYFATEAEAKAAQTAARTAQVEGQTKIPKSDLQEIKNRIKKGDTLEEIAKDYKSTTKPIEKLLRDNNTSYSALTPNISYLEDADSLKYIEDNYGKLKGETMGKKLYPELSAKIQLGRVRKLVAKLIKEKKIEAIPAGFIEEVREERNFNPEESAKKVSAERIAKIKKFSVPAFEAAMRGSKASQLSHMDDLGSQIVRFETLGYSPQQINQEILKNVDPYLNQLYKERDKLFKNKPKGYVDKINKINDKGAAVAYATRGYKSFSVEEPITRKIYSLGLDATKTVDPLGLFEGKTIQEVSPKNFRGNIKAIDKIISDPVDRYIFLENAKAIQKAQANIPESEIAKISQNLKELGFDTSPFKLFSDVREDAAANGPICKIVRTKKADGGTISCVQAVEEAIQENPKKLANDASKIGKFKQAATGFLNFLKGPGPKTFGIGAGIGTAVGLVKLFKNDDPTTYLSNEDQQKNMLVDMATQPVSIDIDRPAILDYQLPALGGTLAASTALAAPSTIRASRTTKRFASRAEGIERKKPTGPVKTGLRVLGRGFGVAASPALLAPFAAGDIASQIAEGDSPMDIATDPLNYLYPAFAEQTPKLTRGLPSVARKVARLGLSRPALTALSRLGIGGFAASAAIQGLGLLDD